MTGVDGDGETSPVVTGRPPGMLRKGNHDSDDDGDDRGQQEDQSPRISAARHSRVRRSVSRIGWRRVRDALRSVDCGSRLSFVGLGCHGSSWASGEGRVL